MKLKDLFGILLAVVLLAVPVAAHAIDLVYPADKTAVTRSDFLIIKGGSQPTLDGMTIAINGAKSDLVDISSAEYKNAFGDFLILQPSFDPGRNQVVVEGYAGGKVVARTTADIYYLNTPSAQMPAGYQPYIFHTPQREALCAGCHNMQPTQAQLEDASPKTNPCASCHLRMLNKKHVHGPAGVLSCTYCHQPDSKPNRYQDRGGDAKLCNECHMDKVKEFETNKYVHGPVAVGLCSICHDPHASDYPAQAVLPINDLCLSCHVAVQKSPHVVRGIRGEAHPLKGVPDPSTPGRELSCVSCHNPHGGGSEYFFVRKISSRFGLCSLCHNK